MSTFLEGPGIVRVRAWPTCWTCACVAHGVLQQNWQPQNVIREVSDERSLQSWNVCPGCKLTSHYKSRSINASPSLAPCARGAATACDGARTKRHQCRQSSCWHAAPKQEEAGRAQWIRLRGTKEHSNTSPGQLPKPHPQSLGVLLQRKLLVVACGRAQTDRNPCPHFK